MFCNKCGKELDDCAKFCSSCGTACDGAPQSDEQSDNRPIVIVEKKGGCLKGCLVGFLCLIIGFVALVVIVGGDAVEEEEKSTAVLASVSPAEAARNGERLVSWIRNKYDQTDLARDDAFGRMKGKAVQLTGKVRQVGKTALTDRVFVSLTVGKLNALKNINVQFNVRESQVEIVRKWNIGEVHTLRGLVAGQGDLEDDACCDLAEVGE